MDQSMPIDQPNPSLACFLPSSTYAHPLERPVSLWVCIATVSTGATVSSSVLRLSEVVLHARLPCGLGGGWGSDGVGSAWCACRGRGRGRGRGRVQPPCKCFGSRTPSNCTYALTTNTVLFILIPRLPPTTRVDRTRRAPYGPLPPCVRLLRLPWPPPVPVHVRCV